MATAEVFNFDLIEFANRIEADYSTAIQKASIDLLSAIVRKTPVDTGRARGAWTVGINSSPEFTNTLSKPKAPRFSETLKLLALEKEPYSLVVIGNNLPYIRNLENGSSNQAAQGMVAVSIAEVRSNPE